MSRAANFIDLTGKSFHRLTVVQYANESRWYCVCVCGTPCTVRAGNLTNGHTRSCGCWKIEVLQQRNASNGQSKTKTAEYQTWRAMKQRCRNPKHPAYKDYGGRGITIEWPTFEAFVNDMGPCPSGEHSIDRYPDPHGPYSRTNSRWATPYEQQNNKRNNILRTYAGKTQSIAQWAREAGMAYNILWRRLQKGWSLEKALTEPVKHRKHSRK